MVSRWAARLTGALLLVMTWAGPAWGGRLLLYDGMAEEEALKVVEEKLGLSRTGLDPLSYGSLRAEAPSLLNGSIPGKCEALPVTNAALRARFHRARSLFNLLGDRDRILEELTLAVGELPCLSEPLDARLLASIHVLQALTLLERQPEDLERIGAAWLRATTLWDGNLWWGSVQEMGLNLDDARFEASFQAMTRPTNHSMLTLPLSPMIGELWIDGRVWKGQPLRLPAGEHLVQVRRGELLVGYRLELREGVSSALLLPELLEPEPPTQFDAQMPQILELLRASGRATEGLILVTPNTLQDLLPTGEPWTGEAASGRVPEWDRPQPARRAARALLTRWRDEDLDLKGAFAALEQQDLSEDPAALGWRAELALSAAASSRPFWDGRESLTWRTQACKDLSSILERHLTSELVGRALYDLGWLRLQPSSPCHDQERGRGDLEAAARMIEDRRVAAAALALLGDLELVRGDPGAARVRYERARALLSEVSSAMPPAESAWRSLTERVAFRGDFAAYLLHPTDRFDPALSRVVGAEGSARRREARLLRTWLLGARRGGELPPMALVALAELEVALTADDSAIKPLTLAQLSPPLRRTLSSPDRLEEGWIVLEEKTIIGKVHRPADLTGSTPPLTCEIYEELAVLLGSAEPDLSAWILYNIGRCRVRRYPDQVPEVYVRLLKSTPPSGLSGAVSAEVGFIELRGSARGELDWFRNALEAQPGVTQAFVVRYGMAWSQYKHWNGSIESLHQGEEVIAAFLDLLEQAEQQPAEMPFREVIVEDLRVRLATSLSEQADALRRSPLEFVQERLTRGAYNAILLESLARIAANRESWDPGECVRILRFLQEQDPQNANNPSHQQRLMACVARAVRSGDLSLGLTVEEETLRLATTYGPGTPWWEVHAGMERGRSAVNAALLQVAVDQHIRAQKSMTKADFLDAARWYRLRIDTAPLLDDRSEILFYLADALRHGGDPAGAAEVYETLLSGPDRSYHEGATFFLVHARRQVLLDRWGKESTLPPDAVMLPGTARAPRYTLTEAHRLFIEAVDRLVANPPGDEQELGYAEAYQKDAANLKYLPGLILCAFGHIEEGSLRLRRVLYEHPGTIEARWSADFLIKGAEARGDLKWALETAQKALEWSLVADPKTSHRLTSTRDLLLLVARLQDALSQTSQADATLLSFVELFPQDPLLPQQLSRARRAAVGRMEWARAASLPSSSAMGEADGSGWESLLPGWKKLQETPRARLEPRSSHSDGPCSTETQTWSLRGHEPLRRDLASEGPGQMPDGPQSVRLPRRMAIIEEGPSDRAARAARRLQSSSRTPSDDPRVPFYLSVALADQGRDAEALAWNLRLLHGESRALGPNPWFNQALLLLRTGGGDPDTQHAALDAVERALASSPADPGAVLLRARLLRAEARFEEAASTLEDLARLVGLDRRIFAERAALWLELGQSSVARALLDALYAVDPEAGQEPGIALMEGRVREEEGRMEEAQVSFESAWKASPSNPEIVAWLARHLVLRKDRARALSLLEPWVEARPADLVCRELLDQARALAGGP